MHRDLTALAPHERLTELPVLLRDSCLENPRDWGAWWAAVYGVAQSRIRLKRTSHHEHIKNTPLCGAARPKDNVEATPVFLPGESQGLGSLVGCCLWGHTESDTTEVT